MEFLMTQFTATPERTGNWLHQLVLADDTRLLLMIRDDTGQWIGNFGVCGISSGSAELDNLIRGAKGGHARLIFYSELALMRWLYETLEVATIRLRVFSHNRVTLRLHRSVGFVQRQVLPLGMERTRDTRRYFTSPQPHHARAEFDLVEMAMDRNEFFARHTWLEG